ncbi:hypothetical protein BU23DRAFT_233150 [Bimuria novae-zelandiae CBS 107.79]|uniref:Uncharacterized protein n=1 Tax=Bimuria novae-zelandiae CBS 107.79 TaxID=1447943 RepID=A0A6A5UYK9_9PLEO|nr:hypothetical protein BU23DRAFT_233150 [Bimuria novae-zelandiae CBS 107.79]
MDKRASRKRDSFNKLDGTKPGTNRVRKRGTLQSIIEQYKTTIASLQVHSSPQSPGDPDSALLLGTGTFADPYVPTTERELDEGTEHVPDHNPADDPTSSDAESVTSRPRVQLGPRQRASLAQNVQRRKWYFNQPESPRVERIQTPEPQLEVTKEENSPGEAVYLGFATSQHDGDADMDSDLDVSRGAVLPELTQSQPASTPRCDGDVRMREYPVGGDPQASEERAREGSMPHWDVQSQEDVEMIERENESEDDEDDDWQSVAAHRVVYSDKDVEMDGRDDESGQGDKEYVTADEGEEVSRGTQNSHQMQQDGKVLDTQVLTDHLRAMAKSALLLGVHHNPVDISTKEDTSGGSCSTNDLGKSKLEKNSTVDHGDVSKVDPEETRDAQLQRRERIRERLRNENINPIQEATVLHPYRFEKLLCLAMDRASTKGKSKKAKSEDDDCLYRPGREFLHPLGREFFEVTQVHLVETKASRMCIDCFDYQLNTDSYMKLTVKKWLKSPEEGGHGWGDKIWGPQNNHHNRCRTDRWDRSTWTWSERDSEEEKNDREFIEEGFRKWVISRICHEMCFRNLKRCEHKIACTPTSSTDEPVPGESTDYKDAVDPGT